MNGKRIINIIFFLMLSIFTGCSSAFYESDISQKFEESSKIDEQLEQNQAREDTFYEAFDNKTETVYYDAMDRILNSSNGEADDDITISEYLLKNAYRGYSTIRSMAPILCLSSIGIGILICIVARHTKSIRKVGIYGFIIGIPLFLLLFVYGIGILSDMFLF